MIFISCTMVCNLSVNVSLAQIKICYQRLLEGYHCSVEDKISNYQNEIPDEIGLRSFFTSKHIQIKNNIKE